MIYGFSSGIEYKFGKNGTASIVSVGSCTDKHIIIPEFFEGKTVTAVEDGAFSNCDGIVSITLPHTVSQIGKNAFDSCQSVVNFTLPQTLKTIGDEAFRSCFAVSTITIPVSVTSIGRLAFIGCTSLSDLYCTNNNLVSIDLSDCTSIFNLYFSDTNEKLKMIITKTI